MVNKTKLIRMRMRMVVVCVPMVSRAKLMRGRGSRSQIWITLDDEQSWGSPSRNNWLLMVILSGGWFTLWRQTDD